VTEGDPAWLPMRECYEMSAASFDSPWCVMPDNSKASLNGFLFINVNDPA